MVVAPGRMIDSFLSIPDAESLPLYRMVLKLACVCAKGEFSPNIWYICMHSNKSIHFQKFQFTNIVVYAPYS